MADRALTLAAGNQARRRRLGAALVAASVLALAGCVTSDSAGTPETVARVIEAETGQPHGPLFPELPMQAASVHPANGCLTADEAAAHHIVRLHTELMVTGLTCRAYFEDEGLFDHYQTFTYEHQDSIRASQRTLANYLARYRSGNSNRLFDTYRTGMANNESLLVQSLSASRYCSARRDQFYAAARLTPAEMGDYLTQAAERYRDSYTACGS